MKYKFFEKTADAKFQAYGKNIDEAFFNAALAEFSLICTAKVKLKIKKKINVEGKDLKALLYNFLEEFLFLFDSENFVAGKIKNLKIIQGKKYSLSAVVWGDNAENYEVSRNVKAVTYNEMEISEDKKNKRAMVQVVLDL